MVPDTQVRLTIRRTSDTGASNACVVVGSVHSSGGDGPVDGAADRRPARSPRCVLLPGDRPAPVTGRPARTPPERGQLSRLRRWGTVGALLLMLGHRLVLRRRHPDPEPGGRLRVIGLLSRIGPAALACSYAGIGLIVLCWVLIGRLAAPGRRPAAVPQPAQPHAGDVGGAAAGHPAAVLPGRLLLPGHRLDDGARLQPVRRRARTTRSATPTRYAHQVDVRWQHTASPYGPVYLLIAKAVVAVAGAQRRRRHAAAAAGRAGRRRADRLGAAAAGPDLRLRSGRRALAGRAEPAGAVPPDRRRAQRGADARRDAGRDRHRLGMVAGRRRRADHPGRRDQGDRRDGAGRSW